MELTPSWTAALRILRGLRAAGHEAWFAGGAVRDHLLGLSPADVDIAKIANTYHAWRGDQRDAGPAYEDVPGFCKSAALDEIRQHGRAHSLSLTLPPLGVVLLRPEPADA